MTSDEGTAQKRAANQLRLLISSILGYIITVEEMREAMELPPTTYYTQRDEGRLLALENLRNAARNLHINEVLLLVQCGLLDAKAVQEYFAITEGSPHPTVPGATKTLPRPSIRPTKASEVRVSYGPDL